VHVERLMDDATRALAAARGEPGSRADAQGASTKRVDAVAAADGQPAGASRGN
jgi:hypothetical protein